MGFRPLEDLAQLLPVIDLLEGQLLHWSAGDDHAVVGVVLDLVKGLVEGEHVLGGGVLADVRGHHQQIHLHLQGGIAQQAGQLGLGGDLGGHEVEQQDLQRTDILGDGAVRRHDEDVLASQLRGGGQVVGNLDGHGSSTPFILIGSGRYHPSNLRAISTEAFASLA